MKSFNLITMAIVISLAISACNNSGKGSVQSADSANSAKIDSGTVGISNDETEFMVKAANGGMTEVELGKVAQDKARNQRVKDFATMMVRDHSQANDQLKSFAQSQNVTLPDSLSGDSKDNLEKISKKTGSDFDKNFMKIMLDDHQKTVDLFQTELKSAENPDLKQWIISTLPTLQIHLDSAKAINDLYGYKGSTQKLPTSTPPATIP